MRFANAGGRPAVIDGDHVRPVDLDAIDVGPIAPAGIAGVDPFIAAIGRWNEVRPALAAVEPIPLEPGELGPPVPRPGKIVGIPVNYVDHQREMNAAHTVAGLGFFLKSPSSIIGPGGTVALPFPDRRTDQEAELGVVIGTPATDVPSESALSHVFGYTCLVDVTVRGPEDRSTRKSFAGFTPIGPWITTAEDIPDPTDLGIRGWVNDELRQEASTAQMVFGVADLIAFVSSVVTLEPGDIIATGTPAGVGPIATGDTIRVEIDAIGSLEVAVTAARRRPHELWSRRVGSDPGR